MRTEVNFKTGEVTEHADYSVDPLAASTAFAAQKAAELSTFRANREALLNRLPGLALFAIPSTTENVALLKTFRQGLLDLPAFPTVVAATDITSLKYAMKMQYLALVSALPNELKAAFGEVDK